MEGPGIDLDDRELTALRALSRRTGRPVEDLVRDAIDSWLDQQGLDTFPEDESSRRLAALLARRDRLAAARGWTEAEAVAAVERAVAEARSQHTARGR